MSKLLLLFLLNRRIFSLEMTKITNLHAQAETKDIHVEWTLLIMIPISYPKFIIQDSCGVLVDSGITVSLVHPIDITVDGVYLGDNTKCIIKAINSVTITVDTTPLSTVHYAILTDSAENPTEYDLEECSFTEKNHMCFSKWSRRNYYSWYL